MLNDYYLWIKAIHIISIVCWMAMLFYLPRLFIYHCENKDNKSYTDIVKIQEQKLYNFIGQPAMLLTLVSGILMILSNPDLFKSGIWLHIKLTFVVILIVYHFLCGRYVKTLALGINTKSSKFFRIFNEIPTICLIIIVICAVIKF